MLRELRRIGISGVPARQRPWACRRLSLGVDGFFGFRDK